MNKYWKLIFIFVLIFLGKLSGLIKDILITFYHGVSIITDAYFLSNSISSVLYMAIYSAIPVIVIPLYSRLIGDGVQSRINKDISAAIFFFFSLSACVAVLVFSGAQWLVSQFSGEIDGQIKELTVSYLSIMALTFVLSTLVSFLNSMQTVRKVTIPSYVVPIINNSVFCIGLYFFSSASDFYKILVLGILAWLILLIINYFISRESFSFKPKAAFTYFGDKKFILLFLPAVISFYIEQMNNFVGVYFASALGVGEISVLGYSNKLNMIFLSVFLVFLTASIFPRIAVISVQSQAELFKYLMRCLRLVIIFSVPIVIYMSFYSVEIVGLLFQRGNFTSDDVVRVSAVFSVVLLALPFCLIRDIMNRVFFSFRNTLIPVILSLISLAINFSLSYLVYKQYGLLGLAGSAVISIVLNCFFVIFLVQRKIRFNLILPSIKVLVLCVFGGGMAYFFLNWLHASYPEYWLILFVPYIMLYLISLLFFRIREVRMIFNLISVGKN